VLDAGTIDDVTPIERRPAHGIAREDLLADLVVVGVVGGVGDERFKLLDDADDAVLRKIGEGIEAIQEFPGSLFCPGKKIFVVAAVLARFSYFTL